MSSLRVQRSHSGYFLRSQAGVRGRITSWISNGASTCTASLTALIPVNAPLVNSLFNRRHDLPYGTFLSEVNSSASSIPSQHFGKDTANTTGIFRGRLGMSFQMPNLTNVIAATLHICFNNYFADFEGCTPTVYASNTGDQAGPAGWQNNLNNFCGTGTYGSALDQAIDLPLAAISGRSGQVLSLVIGQGLELIGGGSPGDTDGSSQKVCFSWTNAPVIPSIECFF